jgi:hypothetical protein
MRQLTSPDRLETENQNVTDHDKLEAAIERKFVLNRDGALRNAHDADVQFIEDAKALLELPGDYPRLDIPDLSEDDDDEDEIIADIRDEAESMLFEYGYWVQPGASPGDYTIYKDLTDEEQEYLRENAAF